jgi:hypothetical protein
LGVNHSVEADEVDEVAFHVRQDRLDAQFATHLEPVHTCHQPTFGWAA